MTAVLGTGLSWPLPFEQRVTTLAPEPDARARRLPRIDRMALAVAREALSVEENPARVGLVYGSGYGSLASTAEFLDQVAARGPAFGSPMAFFESVHHAPAGQVSICLGVRGPSLTVSSRDLSGEGALSAALELLRAGRARAVLAVAADECPPALEEGHRVLGAPLPPSEGAAAMLLSRDAPGVRDGVSLVACELRQLQSRGLRVVPGVRELTPLLERVAALVDGPLCVAPSLPPAIPSDEREALRRVFPSADLVEDASRTGVNPSRGLLMAVAMARRLAPGQLGLVHGLSSGGGQAVVLLRRRAGT